MTDDLILMLIAVAVSLVIIGLIAWVIRDEEAGR